MREEEIRRRAEAGQSAAQVAHELGISRQWVHQIAAKNGITFRQRSFFYRDGRVPAARPRVQTGGVEVAINQTVAGTISELLVAADLMARGWHVFLPVIASKGHDIIASKNGHLATIEVRSAHRNSAGKLIFGRKPDCESDHYGLVVTGEPVEYDPPLE